MKTNNRFRFVRDEDCHNYIIPADKLHEWRDYLDKIYHKGEYPEEPNWVKSINGYEQYTFENPLKEP